MEKKHILVVGSSNTDLIVQVPTLPRPGETVLGGTFATFPGGKGANQAVAAARAGGEVVFIASVGGDAYGKEAVRIYEAETIQTGHIKVCREKPSGVATITIAANGENAIAVAPGANADLLPADLDRAWEAFSAASTLLIQLETPLETVQKAVDMCKGRNIRVILNPAPGRDLPDSLLAGVQVITPNQTEAEVLTGIRVVDEESARQAATALHRKEIGTVILTLGDQGAFVSDRWSGIQRLVPGFRVDPVDTTAAGDTFNGQLAVALAEGKPMDAAVRLAHAAAALSVQKLGAQSSIPHRRDTERFLAARGTENQETSQIQ
ncbi:MAG: ribokinase [Bacteroidales bacterium]